MRIVFLTVFAFFCLLPALASAGAVEVVFFSSPQCPFCGIVAERDLEPLEEEHGEALQILKVDTTTETGREVFLAAWEVFSIPRERRGVPMVIAGDQVLVGAAEIPRELPGLVQRYRASGGLELPSIPGLEGLEVQADGQPALAGERTWRDRFRSDLPGNYISTALLLLMLLLATALLRHRPWQERLGRKVPLSLKLLVATAGLLVAAYLTYGYSLEQELICGPVGKCNVVQHSEMAWLFGVIPIALLGVLAYAALLGIYLFGHKSEHPLARYAPAAALVVGGAGFAFSILLTFWQPFVIGATCSWCLLSAITMSLSFLFAIGLGRPQLKSLLFRKTR